MSEEDIKPLLEHELLCCTEKIVVKAEDLVTWISPSPGWNIGLRPPPTGDIPLINTAELAALLAELLPKFSSCPILLSNLLDAVTKIVCPSADVSNQWEIDAAPDVHVISFNRYCRLRALLLRMREFKSPKWLRYALFYAVSGLEPTRKDVNILFCRQTFECEDLKKIEKRCDYLAPNLKGRPRKRSRLYEMQLENRKKARRAIREQVTRANRAAALTPVIAKPEPMAEKKEILNPLPVIKEKDFMKELRAYMKELKMPLGKVPCLGGKSIDLFKFYKFVQDHGGYQKMCDRRLWKRCYEHMKCPRASTAAATQTRKHYEKLLLPYEAHQKERACLNIIETETEAPKSPKSPAKRAKTKTKKEVENNEVQISYMSDAENSSPVPNKRRKTKSKAKLNTQDVRSDNETEKCAMPSPETPALPCSELNDQKAETEIVLESEDVDDQDEKVVSEKATDFETEEIDLRCSEEISDAKLVPVLTQVSTDKPVKEEPVTNHRIASDDLTRDTITQTPGGQMRKFESQSEMRGKFTVSNLSVELSGTIYDYVSNVIGQAALLDRQDRRIKDKPNAVSQSKWPDSVASLSSSDIPALVGTNQSPSYTSGVSSPLGTALLKGGSEVVGVQNGQPSSADDNSSPGLRDGQVSSPRLVDPIRNISTYQRTESAEISRIPPLLVSNNQRPSVIQPSGATRPLPAMPPLLANYEPISPPTPEIVPPTFKPALAPDTSNFESNKLAPRSMESHRSIFADSPKLVTALSPRTQSPSTPQKSPRSPWTHTPFSWTTTTSPIPSTSALQTSIPAMPSTSAPADDTPLDLSIKPKLKVSNPPPEISTTASSVIDNGALDLSVKRRSDIQGARRNSSSFTMNKTLPKLIPLRRTLSKVDAQRVEQDSRDMNRPGTSSYWKEYHLNPYSNGIMYTAPKTGTTEPSAWDRIYSLYNTQPQLPKSPQTIRKDQGRAPTPRQDSISSDSRHRVYQGPHAAPLISNTHKVGKPTLTLNSAPTLSAFGPAYMDYMSQLSYLNRPRHHMSLPDQSVSNQYLFPTSSLRVLPGSNTGGVEPTFRLGMSSGSGSIVSGTSGTGNIISGTAGSPLVLGTGTPMTVGTGSHGQLTVGGAFINGMYGSQFPAFYGGYMSTLTSPRPDNTTYKSQGLSFDKGP